MSMGQLCMMQLLGSSASSDSSPPRRYFIPKKVTVFFVLSKASNGIGNKGTYGENLDSYQATTLFPTMFRLSTAGWVVSGTKSRMSAS